MKGVRLSDAHRAVLEGLYDSTARTRDDLPYTEEFESLYTSFIAKSGLTLSRHEVWRALASLGKGSRLRRKER